MQLCLKESCISCIIIFSSEGKEDTLMNDLMVDWFTLIRNKQVYMRRESELVYM